MIVLDTHAWIWSVDDPDRLSGEARGAINASDEPLVSTMSVWEFGMLVARGRIALDRPVDDWLDQALLVSGVRLVEVDFEVAVTATTLMDTAADPADAMIAATGLAFGAPIVTRDRRLAAVPHVRVIW